MKLIYDSPNTYLHLPDKKDMTLLFAVSLPYLCRMYAVYRIRHTYGIDTVYIRCIFGVEGSHITIIPES